MRALILEGRVHELFPDGYPDDAAFDIRDVSGIAGIAVGWVAEDGGKYMAPPSPEVLSVPLITYKADIYRRCTDAEAESIEMALASAPVRQRRLFEESQYLDHSDEAFATMHHAMVEMFGLKRADELLAPA